jgi:hypothetical protein
MFGRESNAHSLGPRVYAHPCCFSQPAKIIEGRLEIVEKNPNITAFVIRIDEQQIRIPVPIRYSQPAQVLMVRENELSEAPQKVLPPTQDEKKE